MSPGRPAGPPPDGGPAGVEEAVARSGPQFVVVTGMSGAGRSQAIHTFEDFGYFCIDNLPPAFIRQMVELTSLPGSKIRRVAVACDVRGREFFDQLSGELQALEEGGVEFHLLYLEADDETLVRRFKETRRRHPLEEAGSIVDAIAAEREALAEIRGRSGVVIDTSEMRPSDLREAIRDEFFSGNLRATLSVTVSSFGFKYGLPIDADIVMDVRFLPNPYYDPDLRPLTGTEEPVREYVLSRGETKTFLDRWFALLDALMPGYLAEGKTHLSIAMGCTGGMHRSVCLAEETASHLRRKGFRVSVSHRDIGKDRLAR
ncbi:MAG: RNase adapter RapZ [Coriobacteriia bacterium]|nr:RNase adapter RapZ [Coriobacteriia bacterium]